MTKEDFITAATQAAQACRFPPGIAVAQAALESAWGQSRLAQKANNYFGIKAHDNGSWVAMPTTECVLLPDGSQAMRKLTARFACYSSMAQCFADRDRLIATLAGYAEARGHAAEPIAFLYSLAKHWATDPDYAEKLERIYRQNGFDKIDSAATSQSQK